MFYNTYSTYITYETYRTYPALCHISSTDYLTVTDYSLYLSLRRLLLVDLPHIKSHLLSGASTALGMAWKSGVAAEVIGIPTGSIGENLYQSKVEFDTSGLFAWTAVIVALSVLFAKITLCMLRFAYRRLERL